jgi:peptidoglycan/LPS O-acetylase OafA/YrhL
MFGVALSYFWQFHCSSTTHEKLYRIRYALIGGGLLLLTPAFWYDYHEHHWIFIFGFVLFYLGAGCLMLGCLKVFADRHSPPLRAVSYLGSHSYSVYLWHVPVFGWVVPPVLRLCGFTSCWPAYSVLAFCLVWGCGIVAAKLVEMPVLKLRDRLFPATTKAL